MVNNDNINFANYFNILNFMGETLKNHPSIEFVSQGQISDIDNFQFPKYPFANFIITNITVDNNLSIYTINLIVGDKVKELKNDNEIEIPQLVDFYGKDDEVYIFANTSGIINDVLSYIDNQTRAFNIEGSFSLTPFSDKYKNGISGFSTTFNLSTFNNRNSCNND